MGTDADRWLPAMAIALEEADLAAKHGDVPVGAVVVDEGGLVLSRGRNRREIDGDPVAHAEVNAIRDAARLRGHWRLDGCTLVVTLEPCAMCAGAVVSSRLTRVVFGASDPKAGAVRTLFRVADDPRLNHRAEILGGVEPEASAARLRAFFLRLRAEGQK